ncbi:hypothetical protein [Streptomyces sp. NBC_01764]|uniref:hypothetical protein n=1 Tax=Streptomyces sp. NBC_01764 TaxID=2975935 RepID=UPI00225865CF|nr:hypothetical protein [Streptomyces sp. NBC_01764]
MPEIWAGLDIGKEHHHCVVLDGQGERLPGCDTRARRQLALETHHFAPSDRLAR